MTERQRKTFKLFLIFVGGLVTFTLLSVVGLYIFTDFKETNSALKLITTVLILISIVYLAISEKLNSETIASLMGAVLGYVLGSN